MIVRFLAVIIAALAVLLHGGAGGVAAQGASPTPTATAPFSRVCGVYRVASYTFQFIPDFARLVAPFADDLGAATGVAAATIVIGGTSWPASFDRRLVTIQYCLPCGNARTTVAAGGGSGGSGARPTQCESIVQFVLGSMVLQRSAWLTRTQAYADSLLALAPATTAAPGGATPAPATAAIFIYGTEAAIFEGGSTQLPTTTFPPTNDEGAYGAETFALGGAGVAVCAAVGAFIAYRYCGCCRCFDAAKGAAPAAGSAASSPAAMLAMPMTFTSPTAGLPAAAVGGRGLDDLLDGYGGGAPALEGEPESAIDLAALQEDLLNLVPTVTEDTDHAQGAGGEGGDDDGRRTFRFASSPLAAASAALGGGADAIREAVQPRRAPLRASFIQAL
jgi:hypothetical protein